MKIKFLLPLFVAVIINGNSQAQWIQSLTVFPPSPTINDTIMVLADCGFPSGNCDNHTQYHFVNGNTINGGALHCLGMLSIICNHTDTFLINPLPAGNYTFHFQLDAGYGIAPCTPGIIAGPTSDVNFTVSSATGISEYIPTDEVMLYPNPPDDYFNIKGVDPSGYPVTLSVFTPAGSLYKQVVIKNGEEKITTKDYPSGMYQVQLRTRQGQQFLIPLLRK